MSKLLAGIFLGVFAGAFTYEVLKRLKPDWADLMQDGVEKTVDGIENAVVKPFVKPFTEKTDGKSRARSIPVE